MIVTMKTGQTEYLTPVTAEQVALDMGKEDAILAKVNGEVVDLSYLMENDCTLELLRREDTEAKTVYQHTAAHLLGQAVKAVFPTAKLVEAPAEKDGFRYDVAFAADPEEGALGRLSQEMSSIIKADMAITREEMSRTQAIKVMRRYGEYYKIQIIEALPKGTRVCIYRFGDFEDLTQGPHLGRTGQIVDFLLTAMYRLDGPARVWRIEGKALYEKAAKEAKPLCGKAKTYGVRSPLRKRNNM